MKCTLYMYIYTFLQQIYIRYVNVSILKGRNLVIFFTLMDKYNSFLNNINTTQNILSKHHIGN